MNSVGPRRWPWRVLLLAAGAVIGLVLAELFVRAFVAVRDVGPPLSEYDAVLGQRLKPNLRCVRETPEFRMHFSSNSLGWRGPQPATPKAEIVFLGDSFTMGYGVDDGLEFPQLIAHALGKTVVNMGLGATGNARWPLLLRDAASSLEPRVVVLQLCSNDLEDNLREGLASIAADGTLVRHRPPPPSTARRLQVALDAVPGLGNSHLLGLVRQSRMRAASSAAPALESGPPPGLALAQALLEQSLRCCLDRGWKVIVVSADMNAREAAPFAEVCRDAGVAFVRLPSKREAPELYFAVDGHWTAAGHRHAAERLAPLLE